MSNVIDFSKYKDKQDDKEVDKFIEYIQSLYYEMASGNMNPIQLYFKIDKYMKDNNITQEKFQKVQQKFLREVATIYGIDIEKIIKTATKGTISNDEKDVDIEIKTDINEVKVKDEAAVKISTNLVGECIDIENSLNKMSLYFIGRKVLVVSSKNVNLEDKELNALIHNYKTKRANMELEIILCQNSNRYNY